MLDTSIPPQPHPDKQHAQHSNINHDLPHSNPNHPLQPREQTRPTTLRNRPSFHLLTHSSNLSRHFRQGLLDTAAPATVFPGLI
jgi:hypothetical protein